MMIWMDDALFSGGRYIDCLSVLHNAAIRGHSLTISNDPSEKIGSPNFNEWKHSLSEKIEHEVDNILDRLKVIPSNSVDRGFSERLLITHRKFPHINKSCFVNIDQAIRAVSLPLHILVENQINDSAFLRSVMPPSDRKKLSQWERQGQIRYIQGGGITEIRKLIAFHVNDENSRSTFGLPTDIWKLLHFIIYDHDGNANENPSSDSEKVRLICESNGMSDRHHRLKRRTQENYIPLKALREIINKSDLIDSDRTSMINKIDLYKDQQDLRFFKPVVVNKKDNFSDVNEKLFKNAFANENYKDLWKDEWFREDESGTEMASLAKSIASCI